MHGLTQNLAMESIHDMDAVLAAPHDGLANMRKVLHSYSYGTHTPSAKSGEYYCRMANAVMPASRKFCDCRHCPLFGRFMKDDTSEERPACGYYDFDDGSSELSAREEKARMDRLILWYGVPEYPDSVEYRDAPVKRYMEKALQCAAAAHKGSFRKGTQVPYIIHPVETAMIARTITDECDVIAAAALHDVIEDTVFTKKDIQSLFGEGIASLVAALSENKRPHLPPEASWLIRKQEALRHLSEAPAQVKILYLADKLSNMRAIQADHKKYKDKLWKRFNQKDPAAHAWYYGAVRDICKKELEHTQAFQEYAQSVEAVFQDRGDRFLPMF